VSDVDPTPAELRVLLFSPLAGRDPLSGDTSYTEALLRDPPPGITYTTYEQALDDGTLRVLGRKPWRGGTAGDARLFLERAVELAARRSRLMFREPIWHVSIEPGAFNVVHQHLFAVRQFGERTPVVSSAGYPLTEHYRSRDGWNSARLAIAQALEGAMSRVWDVHTPWLRRTAGSVMTVYSQHFRRWLIARGVRPDDVRVVGTGLPVLDFPAKSADGHTLGVIARDFERKGGHTALEAFRLLRAADPRWHMIVATTSANARALQGEPGVELVVDADRQTILTEVHPRIDVLLAPTKADCGAPYGVLEALQAGTCVITSDLPWLDDRLLPPGAHRVEAQPEAVAAAVRSVVSGRLSRAQEAATRLWESTFSMSQLHRGLGSAYREAAAHGQGDRVRVLVVALPRDLADNPFDGFATRHRSLVASLAKVHEVTVLLLGEDDDHGADRIRGVHRHLWAPRPAPSTNRWIRLLNGARDAVNVRTPAERRLGDVAASVGADVAITVGPWLQNEYRPVWDRYHSLHLYEEELSRMVELAPQSRRAQQLRRVEWWLHSRARAQPITVAAISPPEVRLAHTRYPGSRVSYLPFTLDPVLWPPSKSTSRGDVVLVVGNLTEERNAAGLLDVLDELQRRDGSGHPLAIHIVSGPGVHASLEPYLELSWVTHERATRPMHEIYREAWAALVPARRVTGQKTTILQAWACGVPVVSSRECADTVAADDAVAIGADAAELVDRLLELRDRPAERQRLAEAGHRALAADFDPAAQETQFRGLVQDTWRSARQVIPRWRRRLSAAPRTSTGSELEGRSLIPDRGAAG
jgi:glycosyltransferase involved in cell wall biosynthesis